MKIAIFENEYDAVRGAFETANLIEFDNSLEIKIFTSSQNADFETMNKYQIIFVDIDLSQKSEMDGFGVISSIKAIDDNLAKNIIILTGNNKIKETMKERNIVDERIQIIIKPTDYKEITKSINSVVNLTISST